MSWSDAVIVLAWLVCGVAAAGFYFADIQHADDVFSWSPTQRAEKRRENLGFALMFGLIFGPLALILSLGLCGLWQHGWRLS